MQKPCLNALYSIVEGGDLPNDQGARSASKLETVITESLRTCCSLKAQQPNATSHIGKGSTTRIKTTKNARRRGKGKGERAQRSFGNEDAAGPGWPQVRTYMHYCCTDAFSVALLSELTLGHEEVEQGVLCTWSLGIHGKVLTSFALHLQCAGR